jgi:hypothetical protein
LLQNSIGFIQSRPCPAAFLPTQERRRKPPRHKERQEFNQEKKVGTEISSIPAFLV